MVRDETLIPPSKPLGWGTAVGGLITCGLAWIAALVSLAYAGVTLMLTLGNPFFALGCILSIIGLVVTLPVISAGWALWRRRDWKWPPPRRRQAALQILTAAMGSEAVSFVFGSLTKTGAFFPVLTAWAALPAAVAGALLAWGARR